MTVVRKGTPPPPPTQFTHDASRLATLTGFCCGTDAAADADATRTVALATGHAEQLRLFKKSHFFFFRINRSLCSDVRLIVK